LAAPEWDAVRIKALALSSYDPYASDILTAWASLPNLLIRLRDQPNDPHFCSIHEARLFKAKISKVAAGIPFDVEELTLDCESPASPTSCVPSYYSFPTLMVAARYTVYWAIVIIANSILLWEGEVNPSLVYECQFAADNICKSTEFFRRHKPLGHSAIGTKVVLSVAFGTSSVEQQEWIVQEMQDLFEAKSREFWRASLQFTSDVLTGARAGKMEKWVKL
jgi:hypothetical protein